MNGGFQPIAFDPAFQQEAIPAFQCLAFQPWAFQNDCEIPPAPVIDGGGGGGWYGKPSWRKKRFHQELREWFTVEEVKEKHEVLVANPATRPLVAKVAPVFPENSVDKETVKRILVLYKQSIDLLDYAEKARIARIMQDDEDVIMGVFL